MAQVKLFPLATSRVGIGGTAVTAVFGPVLGGFITNPFTAADQGLATAESIFVDFVNTAAASETATTVPLLPGWTTPIPPGFVGMVSVNAPSSGHRFAGVVYGSPSTFTPSAGTFPPSDYSTVTKIIPSYLYKQYDDDLDLLAFVASYNEIAQAYLDWFVTIGLPVYTGDQISGALLDWVAAGLYGLERPTLPSGHNQNLGMLNTIELDSLPLNVEEIIGPSTFFATDDDTFKRILTWHLWRGDRRIFNIRWLKRRVMRFLTGMNGTAGQTDTTYPVSITFGADAQVNINLQSTRRFARGGAILGAGEMNDFYLDEFDTDSVMIPVSPEVPIFVDAIKAGVLELPFQFSYIVNVN